MRKAAIILPTFNEAGAIEKVINGIDQISKSIKSWEIHIIVVDSNSQDGTVEKVNKLRKKITKLYLLSVEKEGLGKAYIQGFQFAFNRINPYLIFEMDADLSHDPDAIPHFLSVIKDADVVIGSKQMSGGIVVNCGLHRRLFSWFANFYARLILRVPISDYTSG